MGIIDLYLIAREIKWCRGSHPYEILGRILQVILCKLGANQMASVLWLHGQISAVWMLHSEQAEIVG